MRSPCRDSGTRRWPRPTLSLVADRGRPPDPDAVRPIIQLASSQGLRILEAQARRAVGLAERDVVELERALEIFERTDAMPYAARVRCELALLTGGSADLAVGLKTLESLGDLDQLAPHGAGAPDRLGGRIRGRRYS